MTNRTATFTFANPTKPVVSQVTLGLTPVDSATAQKATAFMTKIINSIVATLKTTPKYKDNYDSFMASKEFKVSFELPENKDKLLLNIFYTKGTIEFPLSEGTSQSLKAHLTPLAISTKPSATHSTTLPTSSQLERLLQSTPTQLQASVNPLRPATTTDNKSRATDASSTKGLATHSTTLPTLSQRELLLQTAPLIRRTKASDSPQRPVTTPTVSLPKTSLTPPLTSAETSHNFVYRFFAAIFNYFLSFFYDTPEKPKANTSLDVKGQSKATQHSTSGSTTQTNTTGTEKVIPAIRGLRNGNNICFINAIFQALMNMPEIKQALIDAHNAKIEKEAEAITLLEEEILTEESTYFLSIWSSPKRAQLKTLEASREASITLNQALRTYHTTKDMVWLKALRGFDSAWSSWSEQDAAELLDRVLDPVLEPLRGGLNQKGKPSTDIIPQNIDPNLKKSLSRFFPKFGTRVQWAWDPNVIANPEQNPSQLPSDGMRVEANVHPIPQFAVPDTDKPINLQDLVAEQLQMQNIPINDRYNNKFEIDGVLRNCQASQESIVIQSIEGNAPEYIPLQLKRFNPDQSKIETEIVLPENNRITLIVDGENVNYEIHTLVMHSGGDPNNGHYFSYVRKNNGWVEANDSRVAPLTALPKTVEKQVYMVFLKRVH